MRLKGECIKEYFHNYVTRSNDYFIDLENGSCDVVNRNGIDWRVGMIDTGLNTMTGGRLKRLRDWLKDDTFMVTYGDGVGNVDIRSLLEFHRDNGKLATVTAVRPRPAFLVHSIWTAIRFANSPRNHRPMKAG